MKIRYDHSPHPHVQERKQHGPPKRRQFVGFNSKLALTLTTIVGTMWCAYFFAGLALLAMPEAVRGGMMPTIQWLSQTFIQLVMLSVIMVGQNILGQAADRRAELTYKDAEATFHEAQQIQAHLMQQDEALNALLDRFERLEASVRDKA